MSESQSVPEDALTAEENTEEISMDILDTPADNREGGSEEDDEDDDPGEEHEFEIIDQVESEEEDGANEEGKGDEDGKDSQGKARGGDVNGYDYSSSSDDMDDSELHAMLEKGIDKETLKKQEDQADGRPIIKHKIVLRELESDPFDILPVGWVCVTHNCGMPVYLHKETRVCTMARPYSLGSASTRMHDIPISAIPCLQYRKQLEKEKEADKNQSGVDEPGAKEGKTAEDNKMESSLETVQESSNVTETVTSPRATCPVSTTEVKTPQKMWVVSEESFSKTVMQEQKEALHTGTGSYSVMDNSLLRLKDNSISSSMGQTPSTNEENIAVSLDTSTCLKTKETGTPSVTETETSLCPVSATKEKLDSTSQSLSEKTVNEQSEESCLSELTVSSSRNPPEKSCDSDPKEVVSSGPKKDKDIDSLEEGEIVDEDEMKGKVKSASEENKEAKSEQLSSPVTSSHSVITEQTNVNSTINNSGSSCSPTTTTTDNNIAHVVRQEATSTLEPSEMVTSSSNSLATVKRKIELLKSKRGGKLRRLDNGSAVGWPTENNIAVTPLKMGIGDASNTALNASADEKLKAQAAGVKIKSAEERAKESLLDSDTIHGYCTKLFQFKTLEVKKYRSWRERRKHLDERSRRNRPELPPSTKLITCPIPGNLKPEEGGENVKKREFILNPTGKSYLCILHEYMQRTLKIQPLYLFKELENSKTPYGATVTINNIEYGTGYASSKKVAKQEAAKETLKVLIPDLFKKITDQEIKRNISDLSFFDDIKVTDPRVNDLGNKVGQPSPFQLLLECLRRNFGMGNTQCEVSTKPLKNQKCEFTISVGKHTATVVAKNKREGKQLAAQAILAKLHPHVPSWGSLLRLYGTTVEKPIPKSEQLSEIKSHAPNNSVLESLRNEMRKLHKQKEAIQSKGKIIISSKDLPSKMSGVDL